MSKLEYAELHCHSAFSLLDGASQPESLIDRAIELGLKAIALTDHDDLGGVVRFASRAKEHGDYPAIIGVELTLVDDARAHHLTLLARNSDGYLNLSKLVGIGRLSSGRGRPGVTMQTLQSHCEGLLCLSGCPHGAITQAIARGDQLSARRTCQILRDTFGEHFAIEVMDHGLPEESLWAKELVSLACDLQLPWVVTNNVHYAKAQERKLHDVLVCLKHKLTLDEAREHLRPNGEWYLKSAQQMAYRWRHNLEGLAASVKLAERCEFRLNDLVVPLPQTVLPKSFGCQNDYLEHLTITGAKMRWGLAMTPTHHEQLQKEFDLIRRRKLAGYFLIMNEIIEFAEQAHILVQGRGSAANSAVCYCLGITAVDPIRHDLLFERFLSDARDGYPDIDLDIEHHRREEVIQFVYDRYGRNHAAMVCAHHCFRGRSAVHDTARVLGFGVDEGARLAAQVSREKGLDAVGVKAAGFDAESPRVRSLLEVVNGLWGLPRHRGTHVGGFVLSTQAITEFCPVEPAAMDGRTIIQWDKDDLDALKIPKFDLLGLGMLSVLSEGLRLVRNNHKIPAYLYGLPDRQEVYDMVARADTVGVFQIESRAQMNSLPRTRPSTLYELAIQVALIRPGPLQGDMVHPYIRRKRGEEAIDLIHPKLAPILRRTLGIPLFQEQGMRLAVDAAGFTANESEQLRRSISSSRHRANFAPLLKKLRSGLRENQISDEVVERIIQQIASFSTYGFPESHSTSFALLVYASCWLKCFYPAEFLCALINAQPMGFYSVDTLINDAQRHGVDVRPPCLSESHWQTRLEGTKVRLGLHQVTGLGRKAMDTLQHARSAGAFKSADDVIRRVSLSQASWLTLAESGAFDRFIPEGRRAAIWSVLHISKAAHDSLDLRNSDESPVQFQKLTSLEKTIADFKTLGLTTGRHPMLHVRHELKTDSVLTSTELRNCKNGQWVTVGGLVISRQQPETAKGFVFISLEDETGFVNVIVAPQSYAKNRRLILNCKCLKVSGTLSCEQGVYNLKGIRFEAIDFNSSEYLPSGYNFR
ncbi:MAG: error-prone DNA polymerase [Myxococcota bacterium]|nr:error-prone DNA polymerase [Myxococcota bacterium]